MPTTTTGPVHPSLPARPLAPAATTAVTPAKRSAPAHKPPRHTFTKPSYHNAQKRAKTSVSKKPKSAAATFINVAELRRQCFRYLDNASLAKCMRVRKDLVHDVARVLYSEVGWELVRDKLCRKKERTRIYCDAVQTITCKDDFATSGIRRRARNTKWEQYGLAKDPGNNEKFTMIAMAYSREICPNAKTFIVAYKDKDKSRVRIELDIGPEVAKAAQEAMERERTEKNKGKGNGHAGSAGGSASGNGNAHNGADVAAADDVQMEGAEEQKSVSQLAFESLKGTIYSQRRDIIITSTQFPALLAAQNAVPATHNHDILPIRGLKTFERVWLSTALTIRGPLAVADEHIPKEGYASIKTLTFDGFRSLPQDAVNFPEALSRRTDVDAPLADLESLVIPWQSFETPDNCLEVIRAYKGCTKLSKLEFGAKHAMLHMRPQIHMAHLPGVFAALAEYLPSVEELEIHVMGAPEIGQSARIWPDLEQLGIRFKRLKIGIIQRPSRKDLMMNLLYQIAKVMQEDGVFDIEPVPGHANKPFDGLTWSGFADAVKAFRQHLSSTPYRVNLIQQDLYSLGVVDASFIRHMRFDPSTSLGINIIKTLLHAILSDPHSVQYLRTLAAKAAYEVVVEAYRLPSDQIQNRAVLTTLHNRICKSLTYPARWRPSNMPDWPQARGQVQVRLTREVCDFLEYVEFRCKPFGDLAEQVNY